MSGVYSHVLKSDHNNLLSCFLFDPPTRWARRFSSALARGFGLSDVSWKKYIYYVQSVKCQNIKNSSTTTEQKTIDGADTNFLTVDGMSMHSTKKKHKNLHISRAVFT